MKTNPAGGDEEEEKEALGPDLAVVVAVAAAAAAAAERSIASPAGVGCGLFRAGEEAEGEDGCFAIEAG
jgi:hypothetical protein